MSDTVWISFMDDDEHGDAMHERPTQGPLMWQESFKEYAPVAELAAKDQRIKELEGALEAIINISACRHFAPDLKDVLRAVDEKAEQALKPPAEEK